VATHHDPPYSPHDFRKATIIYITVAVAQIVMKNTNNYEYLKISSKHT